MSETLKKIKPIVELNRFRGRMYKDWGKTHYTEKYAGIFLFQGTNMGFKIQEFMERQYDRLQ